MSPELKRIVRLQELDSQIRELQREIGSLPKHIAEIEKTLDSHVRKLEADKAALAANQRERKNVESGIQSQEQKISRLRDQMMEAKTNEQYRAFQKEIEFCEKEVRRSEDRILALMEESEPLAQNAKAAQTALAEEQQRVEEEKARVRARTAADQGALADLDHERQALVRELPAALYAAYERVRAKRGGLAVAEAVEGRCSACHLALRPQLFQDLRVGQGVTFCESCGRILFYNPPVSFEETAAADPPRL
jgi:predicted  nucleic acid-binding Zn-ribbon protein